MLALSLGTDKFVYLYFLNDQTTYLHVLQVNKSY